MADTPLEIYAVISVEKPDDSWDDQSINISVQRYESEELAENEAEKIREVKEDLGTEWYKVEVRSMWVRDWKYDRVDEDEYNQKMSEIQNKVQSAFPIADLFLDFED